MGRSWVKDVLLIYTVDTAKYFEVGYQRADRRSPGDEDEMAAGTKNRLHIGNEGNGFVQPNLRLHMLLSSATTVNDSLIHPAPISSPSSLRQDMKKVL